MIKVVRIPPGKFKALLECSLNDTERSLIKSYFKAQNKYPLLTRYKYEVFWRIYYRYFPYESNIHALTKRKEPENN